MPNTRAQLARAVCNTLARAAAYIDQRNIWCDRDATLQASRFWAAGSDSEEESESEVSETSSEESSSSDSSSSSDEGSQKKGPSR